jgi:hypothetical protein
MECITYSTLLVEYAGESKRPHLGHALSSSGDKSLRVEKAPHPDGEGLQGGGAVVPN